MLSKVNKTQGRLSFLDFIRGIAALAVCFEHGGYKLWPHFRSLTHDNFSFGKFGVAAFFLTSGFVIPYSLEKTNSLRQFWVSRLFRLYPLYWLSIAFGVSLVYLGMADFTDTEFPVHLLRNTLINLTMFQGLVRIPNVIGLYYTLGMEMAFYIAFSLLFIKGLNRKSISIAWFISIAVSVPAVVVPVFMHRRVPLAGLFYIVCLSVGTVIYRTFCEEVNPKRVVALISFVALSTPVEVFCNYVLIRKNDALEQFTFWAVLAPWATAYIVFLAAYLMRARSFPRVFVWLGLISYSVYLLHPPIQAIIPIWPNPFYSFVAMLAMTLGVSTCTYRFVERPGVALGKHFFARYKAADRRSSKQLELIGEVL